MIVFGKEEAAVVQDLRCDWFPALLFDPRLRCLRGLPLAGVMDQDEGRILARPARARGVMAAPEDLEQVFIGYPGRVVIDLEALRMVAEGTVGRIGFRSARVPDSCTDDAGEAPEPGVRPPESARGEGCGSDLPRHDEIDQRFRNSGLVR